MKKAYVLTVLIVLSSNLLFAQGNTDTLNNQIQIVSQARYVYKGKPFGGFEITRVIKNDPNCKVYIKRAWIKFSLAVGTGILGAAVTGMASGEYQYSGKLNPVTGLLGVAGIAFGFYFSFSSHNELINAVNVFNKK